MKNAAELPVYRRLPTAAQGGSGSELLFQNGQRVLDLYGGHCVNTLGAGDDGLRQVILRQWQALSFTTNLIDTPVRERFLSVFGASLPPGGWSIFLSNSGAEANENALKAAFAATGRPVVVAFEGGFHGRTAAAAAVSDTAYPLPRTPFEVRRLPFDDRAALGAIDERVAAVIVEPIQSLAGVVTPSEGYLQALRSACDQSGSVLIFDEVQTGNGRLGRPWASQVFGVIPDAFTTAKGAAGGLPIGITVLSEAVAGHRTPSGFGSTFGGGPTVLAAATEVARRIQDPSFQEAVRALSAVLVAAASRPPVARVRGRGLLLGLELEEDWDAGAIRDALFAEGVLVGTTNDPRILRLTPPLNTEAADACRLRAALGALGVMVP